MVEPITTTIAAFFVPIFIKFFTYLIKNKQSKKRLRAQQASEIIKAEQKQQRRAEEAEEWKAHWRREAEKAEKREANRAWEREERETKRAWVREREAKEEALAKEAKKEQKRQDQLELERKFDEKLRLMDEKLEHEKRQRKIGEKLMDEKLEHEKRQRKIGEKRAEMNTKFLVQALQYAFRLFKDLMLRQQSSGRNHTLEQPEREKLLAHFELLEGGGNDDLLRIFDASSIPQQDNPSTSNTRNIALLELPEQLPGGFEEDILSMAMATINDPGNAQGITLLELDYQLFDDFEDDDIVSSATTDATQAKEKGNAYLKDEEFEEAIKWYSKSIYELPTAATYGNRALAYLKLNKFIEVEKDCTEALSMDDRYFKAYARRAIARNKLGCNLEGALVDVQVALELEPNNQEMVELYAELRSLKAANKAKEEGNAYFKDRNFQEAIICYSASINKCPTVVAYNNRAMAYLNLNKFMEAETDCTEALRMDDCYFKAYARRAIARKKLGCNLEGALVDVQVALELEPNNQEMVELYAELRSLKAANEAKEEGNAYFKDRNFHKAIICYSESINKSPTVVAYSNRAMAYLNLNRFMEAENDCTKALKIDDQYLKAYARRAIARSKLVRNLEGALKDVEVALMLEPDNQEMNKLRVELKQMLK